MIYEHTQRGTLILRVLFGFMALFLVVGLVAARVAPVAAIIHGATVLFLGGIAYLFRSLTVRVTESAVRLRFGSGPIRKEFAVADIRDSRVVQNRAYYGWGIRFTPHGWLYNVSGYDAVEIELRNGRKYRIGTDEPERLNEAIRTARGASSRGT